MNSFVYGYKMAVLNTQIAYLDWQLKRTNGKVTKGNFRGAATSWVIILLAVVALVAVVLTTHFGKPKSTPQTPQPTVSAPTASVNVDTTLVQDLQTRNEDLAETNEALREQLKGQLRNAKKWYQEKLEGLAREANIQIQEYKQNIAALEYNIIDLRKDLEKSNEAMKTLTANYEAKLKAANQKAESDLSKQSTSYETQISGLKKDYETKLVSLKNERDATIQKILAAYTDLIEVQAKPDGVRWMEYKIARSKKGAERIKPMLATGNYVSGHNWELFEQYSKEHSELKTLLEGQLKADYDHYKFLVDESRSLNNQYSPR